MAWVSSCRVIHVVIEVSNHSGQAIRFTEDDAACITLPHDLFAICTRIGDAGMHHLQPCGVTVE